jgi:7-keto-8-aminopelargonate synthetase-like enzyme
VHADVVLGTLGKALGLSGAFIAASPELRSFLENRARSYVYSTAVPAALAATAIEAAHLAETAHAGRDRLRAHAASLRTELYGQGWQVPLEGTTPIIPVVLGEPATAMRISAALLARGFFVQGVRPPTVPIGTSRLRVVPTALHTPEHIAALVAAFQELRPQR